MGFLGIGKSKWDRVGRKTKTASIGAAKNLGKASTTFGKVATSAGKAGVVATPFVTALNPAAGAALATGSAGALAAGSLAKISGRGLKKVSKGKGKKFDAQRALMRD